MKTIFHKSRALRPGDSVAAIAPAGPFERESFEAGLAILAERYRVHYDPGIFQRRRYLAGDDARRLKELSGALADRETRAIFCARGGYGTMRLLPKLAASGGDRHGVLHTAGHGTARQSAPTDTGSRADRRLKPIIGFSDITALHQWRQSQGFVSIHGPVLTQLGRLGRETSERLFALLESSEPAAPLRGTATFVEGTAEGPLLGGNLSMFTRLLGTPYMPDLEGAILIFEDVGERPYRLDRMWTHLELAGVFRQIAGIALGSFTHCEERDADYSSQDILRDLAVATGLPCATGFRVGHGDVNEPVPLGIRVRLDATTAQLTFLESATSEE
ncbi:MAG: LD-carboxypeptidase [Proteobacteria bacterium]|nr:LD-carboxypeptidase [Pseudomonadota bacterium]